MDQFHILEWHSNYDSWYLLNGERIVDGDIYEIKWPAGKSIQYRVRCKKKVHRGLGGMSETTSTEHLYVEETIHGQTATIEIKKGLDMRHVNAWICPKCYHWVDKDKE